MSIDAENTMICPARITLDTAQLSFFDGLPTEAPSVQSQLGCELECGHDGSHAALGQQVEATLWWVQWTLSASEINPYTWCPVHPGSDAQNRVEVECALFDGHPGAHTRQDRRLSESVK